MLISRVFQWYSKVSAAPIIIENLQNALKLGGQPKYSDSVTDSTVWQIDTIPPCKVNHN